MKALHCYRPVEHRSKVVHLLASMCTYEILFNVKETTDSAAEHIDEDDVVPSTQQVEPVTQVVVVVVVVDVVVVVVVVVVAAVVVPVTVSGRACVVEFI